MGFIKAHSNKNVFVGCGGYDKNTKWINTEHIVFVSKNESTSKDAKVIITARMVDGSTVELDKNGAKELSMVLGLYGLLGSNKRDTNEA